MLGSEAAPFSHSAALKNAVENCLTHDPTGRACCGVSHDANCGDPATARCRAAGCDEMGVWDVSSVTNMESLFGMWDSGLGDGRQFNADISGWDVSSVTDMTDMFFGAAAFNQDISGWDTSSVTFMFDMFSGATAFNADITGWDVSSLNAISNLGSASMFYGATAWLASYTRTGHWWWSIYDGPPSAWAPLLPPTPSPPPLQPSPPPPSSSPPTPSSSSLQPSPPPLQPSPSFTSENDTWPTEDADSSGSTKKEEFTEIQVLALTGLIIVSLLITTCIWRCRNRQTRIEPALLKQPPDVEPGNVDETRKVTRGYGVKPAIGEISEFINRAREVAKPNLKLEKWLPTKKWGI